MPEDMNLSINGQSRVPPGFRFHPTEEELLRYYLRKKVAHEKIDLDVIREVDLNKLEPWDIQEKCRIGSAPQNDWYFFSRKDKKYPTGMRTNRATAVGFWKATGRDKIIYSGCRRIGSRKTLVFYRGRAPHGQKSDWIIHEYRLEEGKEEENALASFVDMNMLEDGWVVCRVFRKKNYQKAFASPQSKSTKKPTTSIDSELQMLHSAGNQAGVLDQVLSYMGKTPSKVKNETTLNLKYPRNNNDSDSNNDGSSDCSSNKDAYQLPPDQAMYQERSIDLTSLNSPCSPLHLSHFQPMLAEPGPAPSSNAATPEYSELLPGLGGLSDWASMDRLVASQLNGQTENPEQAGEFFCFGNDEDDVHQMRLNGVNNNQSLQTSGFESDFFWSNFMVKSSSFSSSSDPLRHLSG